MIRRWRRSGRGTENSIAPVVRSHPRSPAAEAFRMIRTNMDFMGAGEESNLWLVTSSMASEGKSTLVANLALALAATGRKTLIIDGDLRRPTQHKVLGMAQSPGLSQALTGMREWNYCIQPVEENLDVITSGPLPPNPAELLQGARAKELLDAARDTYDIVLVDAPPVLVVADSRLLAQYTDRVILVAEAGYTRKDALKEAHQALEKSGASNMAVVLNKVRPEAGYSYYNYEYYGSGVDAGTQGI